MPASVNIIKISTIALYSVVLLLFMRIGSVFYDLKGLSLAIIIPFFFGMHIIFYIRNNKSIIKSARWIFLSILLLSVYYIITYGDKRLTLNLILTYLLPLGVFIIAYYAGIKNQKYVLATLLKMLYLVIIFSLMPLSFSAFTGSVIDKQLAQDVFTTDATLIIFWPFLFLVSTFSLAFIINDFKRSNRIYIALYIVIIISMFISSFTAVIVLMLIAFGGYYFIIASQKDFFRMLMITLVSIIAIVSNLYLISTGYFGDLGGSTKKINAFISLIQSSDPEKRDELLGTTTSGRWASFEISINSFFESPFYGHGFSWDIINPISSQHSSVLDNLAYFGLLSLIILMIYIRFIINAYKLCKLSNQKTELSKNAIFFGLLFGFLVISFLNPYFNFQSINEIIFLIGGWVNGNLRYKQKQNYLEVASSRGLIKL